MKYFKSGYAISLLLLFVIILLPIQVFAEMPPLPPGNDNTDDSGEDIITVNTNLIRSINGKKVYEVINGKRHWVIRILLNSPLNGIMIIIKIMVT